MKNAQIVFESYNQAVEKIYESFMEYGRGDEILKQGEDKVNSLVDAELGAWEKTPVSGLDGMTPEDYFNGIDGIESAIGVFRLGAVKCDRGVPRMLLDKLSTLGETGTNELLEMVRQNDLTDDENSQITIAAIRALGKLRSEKAVKPLIDILYTLNEDKENLVEEINDALVDIGNPIVEPAVQMINDMEQIGYLDEYLLNALVRVGKNNRSDSIFRCLKNAFGKMEDKLLGALCLGDYGDGRAIPALRGYIDKNRGSIDKATFLEIAAAIKKLGGNIDDLVKGTAF